MRRTSFAMLLLPILCAASCARASVTSGTDRAYQRPITLGNGIAVRGGPLLTDLPPAQRFRFVSPDSLVMGLAADDVASIDEPALMTLREAFTELVGGGRWVEAADSVQFDVTLFTTARMGLRREGRPQLAANVVGCGDVPTTTLQSCTDDPISYTEHWSTAHETFLVIRRRSDDAVRIWRLHGDPVAARSTRLVAALRAMLP